MKTMDQKEKQNFPNFQMTWRIHRKSQGSTTKTIKNNKWIQQVDKYKIIPKNIKISYVNNEHVEINIKNTASLKIATQKKTDIKLTKHVQDPGCICWYANINK